MYPLDIYGANILTPRKQHLSGVITLYPDAIPLYLWGEHFQKSSNSLLSFVIHDISLCGNEKTGSADEKSECVDIKAGYLWICKNIEGISHGYATGYRVDMKGYRLDMWDNLTQDRRRRAQGPIHCHCCYLDLNLCPQLCQWIPPS